MSNMTTSGTSTYETGTNDTYTAVVDNVDTVEDNQLNGVLEAMVQVQTILGVGTDVKGSAADLVARLAVRHNADGTHKTQPVDEGGTNITAYTVGDVLYASDTTVLSKLGIGNAYDTLSINAGATAPEWGLPRGAVFVGPSSFGSGSTISHEGSPASSSQSLGGHHFYTDFTLDSGHTITLNDRNLIIVARNSITINGTINAQGQGASGGAGGSPGTAGSGSSDQAGGGGASSGSGGGGTGGDGGAVRDFNRTYQAGASGASGIGQNGSNGTSVTGTTALQTLLSSAFPVGGAGGGGAEVGSGGGTGGSGGGTVWLIAPSITFGAASVLNTKGNNGTAGGGGNDGGGGGGGAGNLLIVCRVYTDSGATFQATGGTGGAGAGTGGTGGTGASGIKQIFVHV